jgi:hypothetical protein
MRVFHVWSTLFHMLLVARMICTLGSTSQINEERQQRRDSYAVEVLHQGVATFSQCQIWAAVFEAIPPSPDCRL